MIPIELMDGKRLVGLFEDAKLGIRPKQIYEIDFVF